MNLTQIKGLKFPDEFVIKFFFKNQLDKRLGNVLELGCGNGNNLMLFHQCGWNVVGLDVIQGALDDANHNFSIAGATASRHFFQRDLTFGLGDTLKELGGSFSAILLPSVLYYIPRNSAVKVLQEVRRYAEPGAFVFLRNRSKRDYRYQRGERVEQNGYRLSESETGEAGLLNVFYDEWELVDMLRENLMLNMQTTEVLAVEFQNPQQGVRVNNSDIIIWGRLD